MKIVGLLAVLCVVAHAFKLHIPTGYIPIPGQRYAHESCIHDVPPNAVINRTETGLKVVSADGSVVTYERCAHKMLTVSQLTQNHIRRFGGPPTHGFAWIVDAMQDLTTSPEFRSMNTTFMVPEAPANPANVVVYLWPGLEDNGEDDVLQPVLQYGFNGRTCGLEWCYQSWFVSSDGTVLTGSVLENLEQRAKLIGSVYLSRDSSQWQIIGHAPNGGVTTLQVTARRAQPQPRAYICLEVYNHDNDCTRLPADGQCMFNSIVLRDSTGQLVKDAFVREFQHPVCNSDANIKTDSVTLTWSVQ